MSFLVKIQYAIYDMGPLVSKIPGILIRWYYAFLDLSWIARIFVRETAGPKTLPLTTSKITLYTDQYNPSVEPAITTSKSAVEFAPDDQAQEDLDHDLVIRIQENLSKCWQYFASSFTDVTTAQDSGYVKDANDQLQVGENQDYNYGEENTSEGVDEQYQLFVGVTPTPTYPYGGHYVHLIILQLYRLESYDGTTVYVDVYECDENYKPTGSVLGSATYPIASLTTNGSGQYVWFEFDPPIWMKWYTNTCVVIYTDSAHSSPSDVQVRCYYPETDAAYLNRMGRSTDYGSSWNMVSNEMINVSTYYLIDGENSSYAPTVTTWYGQTFKLSTTAYIARIDIKLYIPRSVTSILVGVRATSGGLPTGTDLTNYENASFDDVLRMTQCAEFSTLYNYFPFKPTPYQLTSGVVYAFYMKIPLCTDDGNSLLLACRTSNIYDDGNIVYSTTSGSSWSSYATYDFLFAIYYVLADVDMLPATLAVGDYIAWGHSSKKFDKIVQYIAVAGQGTYTLAFEYSQGGSSWASCVGLNDETGSFKNAGELEITHTPQGDWATETLNGTTAYYVRARVTAVGTGYFQPKGAFARVEYEL